MIIENFTPIASTVGGLVIGISAILMLLFNGRIAGISGISKGILSNTGHERSWRALFVLGLIIGGAIMVVLSPEKTGGHHSRSRCFRAFSQVFDHSPEASEKFEK